MRKAHCKTWNMSRKLKNVKNEKCKLQDLDYGMETEKRGKLDTNTV